MRTLRVRRLRQLACLLAYFGAISVSLYVTLFALTRARTEGGGPGGKAVLGVSPGVDDILGHQGRSNSTWIILESSGADVAPLSHLIHSTTGWNVLVIARDGVQSCSPQALCESLRVYHAKIKLSLEPITMPTDEARLKTATSFKMAAVLLAVAWDAQWIYVGPAKGVPLNKLSLAMVPGNNTGLVYSKTGHFDLLRHHYGGQSHDRWPLAVQYKLRRLPPLGVMAFLDQCTSQVLCSPANPPVYLMPGTLASIPPSASLLAHRNSFWMLILTAYQDNNNNNNINKIASRSNRTLVVSLLQRFMWETNQSLAISPSGRVADDIRVFCSRHDCSSKFLKKESLEHLFEITPNKSHCLHNFINNPDRTKDYTLRLLRLKCAWMDESFSRCAHELIDSFFGYQNDKNSKLRAIISAWIQLLQGAGYRFPKRVPLSNIRIVVSQYGLPVWYTPSPCRPKDRIVGNSDGRKDNAWKRSRDDDHPGEEKVASQPSRLEKECRFSNVSISPQMPDDFKITDILLIIVFNYPYLAAQVPMLMTMYGRHFRHILFCGENFPSFVKFYHMGRYPHVSFVEINHAQGTWGYSCMSAAIKMNYDVTGYLQMSDDVLLNVWNLKTIPRDRFWYQSRVRVADIRLKRLPDIATTNRWYPWIFAVGRYAAVSAFKTLKQMHKIPLFHDKIDSFLGQLHTTTQCSTCLMYEASDIFFVPEHKARDFAFFVDIFQANRLHLEVAIPSAIFGLSPEGHVYRLRGNYVWGNDRADFRKYYSDFDHFQHAWKLTRLATKEGMDFFCRHYLPYLEADLSRMSLS